MNLLYISQAEGETEVLVAGDPEHKHMAMCDKQGGMRYHPNAIDILVTMHCQCQRNERICIGIISGAL